MFKSNIVAGSNVFLSREDDPRWDSNFVQQVQDYSKIKDISSRKETDFRIASLSASQHKILENEMRCIYAENDPCWGFSKDKNKVVCACINNRCPLILKCNPNYSDKEVKFWITSDEERRRYGDPNKLPLYYIVDMIPEDEMLRYECNPLNDGLEFLIKSNPVIKDSFEKKDTNQYKIDSKTGRKMVVIGHRWVLDNIGSYEGEELIPIWGYVDEVTETKLTKRKKARRIEKKEPEKSQKPIKRASNVSTDKHANKQEYEQLVKAALQDEYKLTDLSEDCFVEAHNLILVDNPAEQAYVSSMLLLSDVHHGYSKDDIVEIALIDEYEESNNDTIYITSTVIKNGCRAEGVKAWKSLSKCKELFSISVPDREYYEFKYDETSRWCCRNLYGVTHVVIKDSDITDLEAMGEGEYSVSFVEDKMRYMILKKDGDIIGHLRSSFTEMIHALKEAGDIETNPAIIKGIRLIVKDNKATVLGMGNLKFIEY